MPKAVYTITPTKPDKRDKRKKLRGDLLTQRREEREAFDNESTIKALQVELEQAKASSSNQSKRLPGPTEQQVAQNELKVEQKKVRFVEVGRVGRS